MSAMANLRDLSSVACIVGVDESDEMGTLPHKSQLSLHVEAVTNAVRDAGLKVSDIDGVFTAGQHSPATIGEALGITARHVDGTTVGGCSFIIMVGHAVAALHHGLCDVAVISHGESGRSQVGVSPRRDTAIPGQYEAPFGFGPAPTMFGLITTRHMHRYGTTLEQWAQVAVSTRQWAALNPKALRREPITVADVLKARPVVYPFTVLNICLVTDAGGAVVLTRADRAKDCAKKPVYVRGLGEGTEHVSHHAGVARDRQAGRGRALLRGGSLDAGRLAADQYERRRPLLHAHGDVRHLPDHRGRAPAARRGRPAPGARAQDVAGQRHGWDALRRRHAGAGQRTLAALAARGGQLTLQVLQAPRDGVALGRDRRELALA